ncbi:hypothetical protein QGC_1264, partial [Clostridioides difficile CD196]
YKKVNSVNKALFYIDKLSFCFKIEDTNDNCLSLVSVCI